MAELIGDQYMEDGIKKESTPDRCATIHSPWHMLRVL
jgi:hypothetical protein